MSLLERAPTVPVASDAFHDGYAECMICGAYVRPAAEMTQILVRRALGSDAAAGECPVCELVTYFRLEAG